MTWARRGLSCVCHPVLTRDPFPGSRDARACRWWPLLSCLLSPCSQHATAVPFAWKVPPRYRTTLLRLLQDFVLSEAFHALVFKITSFPLPCMRWASGISEHCWYYLCVKGNWNIMQEQSDGMWRLASGLPYFSMSNYLFLERDNYCIYYSLELLLHLLALSIYVPAFLVRFLCKFFLSPEINCKLSRGQVPVPSWLWCPHHPGIKRDVSDHI